MIIVLLVVMTLVAYFGGVYVENRQVGNWIRFISDVLLVGIVALIIANNSYHFGMQKQVEKTTTSVQSALPQQKIPFLLYEPLGNAGKEQVYLYHSGSSKLKHTSTDQTTNRVVRRAGKPELVSEKTVWRYQNNFSRLMFGVAGNDGTRIKTRNTFYLPKNWVVMSSKDAKKLAKPAIQAKLRQNVQGKLQEALRNQPQLTKSEQQALMLQYQSQAIERLIK
ncbi:DUF4811 domain-containing protein [Xylocopilactobacillus apicola]|uniref:DUF4811 domain-containing protein n=1 Tax=Xylocopilactobacillus apicola TaxID=2932184 RepID=A0AAU9D6R7_9LACO|nr:DUF4811 domain-containing protein [Xylocopilactobacillus apicola]BDR58061.1 DUF4811 domain-containing protein [Xylocopilactobacillus apicola]